MLSKLKFKCETTTEWFQFITLDSVVELEIAYSSSYIQALKDKNQDLRLLLKKERQREKLSNVWQTILTWISLRKRRSILPIANALFVELEV